jgi:fructose-bisphosphate aldolase, class I
MPASFPASRSIPARSPRAGRPGKLVTEGLDGLRARLREYFQMGARFAKWRAVISPADGLPSRGCIEANAHASARCAALSQEAGLVPIVEPEVLMAGTHTLEHCQEGTEATLHCVFNQLCQQGVCLESMILKPNMVLPGLNCPQQQALRDVATATVTSFSGAYPRPLRGSHSCPVGNLVNSPRLA